MWHNDTKEPAATRSKRGAGFFCSGSAARVTEYQPEGFHFLTLSACLNLPHPAHWPLQLLPGTGKVFLSRRDTRFQVTSCRFVFVFAAPVLATTVPTLFHSPPQLTATAPSSPTTRWRLSCPKKSRTCWGNSPWTETWCSTSFGSFCTIRTCRKRSRCISSVAPWGCFRVASGGEKTEEVCLCCCRTEVRCWKQTQKPQTARCYAAYDKWQAVGASLQMFSHARTCVCF